MLEPDGRYELVGAAIGAPYKSPSIGASRLLLCSSVPAAAESSLAPDDVVCSFVLRSVGALGDSSTLEDGPLFTTAATC